ncbi:hypothetical protein, partial [Aeromonas salmonicida]|uniref:hypothetical protein n=1 Tax=Aeromonas salmonicida TaxID=645 RepID=UPI003671938A
ASSRRQATKQGKLNQVTAKPTLHALLNLMQKIFNKPHSIAFAPSPNRPQLAYCGHQSGLGGQSPFSGSPC